MRVLVLGGTGAMGEPLIRMLGGRGDEVYVTSRRERESMGNIHFIQGNAHDSSFMQKQLVNHYDAIVDFMIYSKEDFRERARRFVDSTGQYVFLSSARVYADSKEPITENSPRLLDVCKDEGYLKTDEYALAKARFEDVLFGCGKKNWTIIRPYITYNTKRLQLGGLEIETWLSAALSGRAIVLPGDIGMRETTMTYGYDVARALAALIGSQAAMGEVFHITGTDHMKWNDVAEIYLDVLEERLGWRPDIWAPESSAGLSSVMGNEYQIKYDRMYDRVFDNTKLMKACGGFAESHGFLPARDGLKKCLNEYFHLPDDQKIRTHNVQYEAWVDKSSGRQMRVKERDGTKEKLKYLCCYYMPETMKVLKKLKQQLILNK